MKILELDIHGFRSFKKVHWQPGDLNVIIGPNGSGKSNLLRFLEMITVSAQGQLSKYIQRSGGIEPLLWDGSADHIFFVMKASSLDSYSKTENSLTYEFQMIQIGKTSVYRIGKESLGNYFRFVEGKRLPPLKLLERLDSSAIISDVLDETTLKAAENSIPEDESVLSHVVNPFLFNTTITEYQKQLSTWRIYHDIQVDQNAHIRQATIARAEKTVQADAQNLITVLHTLYSSDRYFKQDIHLAMRSAFGDDFDELIFPPAADQRIQMRIRWKSLQREQSAADMSDGTLRFLILLCVLASPSPPPLIAFDEPETGLHPSMLPIIAEYAVEAAKRTQVIFTTHSPQFLDAFNNVAPPTVTVAKWQDGQSVLNVLRGEKLDKWLRGYSLGSLYRSGELESME